VSPAPIARRQRCRALQLAMVLGVFLAGTGVIDRNLIPIVVGLAGVAAAAVVYRRECRRLDDDS